MNSTNLANRSLKNTLDLWNETNSDEINCDFGASRGIFSTTWFRSLIYLLYGVVFVIALTGNGLVCYVVHCNPRMKTVTNFFIVNLALGDILMALFCVPTSSISTLILQHWPFGTELCHAITYLQAVSVLVSAYTLVAISIDRYVAIMWPLKPKLSERQAQLLILAVWMLAMAISLPIAIVSKLSKDELCTEIDRYICTEEWPSLENKYYYSIALLVLQYVIPITVLVFTYTSIAVLVWGKRPPGEAQDVRDQRMARSKRKMVKMMVTVVIVFTVCWLPLNILNLLVDNNEAIVQLAEFPFVWMTLHWLAMSHSCYNPVIYCWMNARFRTGFITVFARLPGARRILHTDRHHNNYNASTKEGIPLTDHSALRRINTCTTYISERRKKNGNHTTPVKSASIRNDFQTPATQQSQRQLAYLESHSEEQV